MRIVIISFLIRFLILLGLLCPILASAGLQKQTIGAISFTTSKISVNDTAIIKATASSKLTVSFTTSTPGFCSIKNKTITGKKTGTCIIIAKQKGNSKYNAALPIKKSLIIGKLLNSLSGVVSIGPVSKAIVKAFKVIDGTKGPLLSNAITNTEGQYNLPLGTNLGPVLVEATGGSYTDPATGVITPLEAVLRSFSTATKGINTANITPITEAVVINASSDKGGITSVNISNSVVIIETQLGYDPIKTKPLDPSVNTPITANAKELAYTATLGTVSQYIGDNAEKALPLFLPDFAEIFKQEAFHLSPQVVMAANNYGANERNVNELITGHVFGDGKVKFATCSDAFNCTGKFQLPRCTQPKPVITCISGKKPLNGVCLNPEPTPMNPYNNLTKNWSGPWNWSGPTATHTCTANNGGTMTMNLIQSGKSFSGSIEATGIQTLNSSTCQVKSTDTYYDK